MGFAAVLCLGAVVAFGLALDRRAAAPAPAQEKGGGPAPGRGEGGP